MNPPPYDTFPAFYTGDLFLRRLTVNDLNDIIEISHYGGKPMASEGEALEMLKRIDNNYLDGTSISWGITTSDGKVAGSIGYYRGFSGNTGEIGFILKKDFEGKGYMTAAVKAAVDFGFDTIGLGRVVAITRRDNSKARAVLERTEMEMTRELKDDYVEYVIERK